MVDKRGASTWAVVMWVVGGIIGAFLLIWIVSLFGIGDLQGKTFGDIVGDYQTMDEALGNSALKPLTYIVGGIPGLLIQEIGITASVIVMIALFVMLAVSFGDILSTFSLYSKPVAWVIGIALTIVAVNFRLLILFAYVCFGLVSGIGVISTVVGIGVPFIIFIMLNFFWLRHFSSFRVRRELQRRAEESAKGIGQTTAGFKAAREAGKAVTEKE